MTDREGPEHSRDKYPPLALRIKIAIARTLVRPWLGAVVRIWMAGIVHRKGLRIDTRTPAVDDQTRAMLIAGVYESAELRLVPLMAPPTTIVELGTSLGVVSSAAARRLGASGSYLGIEANPDLLEIARTNILRNAPKCDVSLRQGAINYPSPEGTPAHFNQSRSSLGSSLSDHDAGFVAPTIRLSSLVTGLKRFTLICDIEGAEVGMFLEDHDAFEHCEQILIELHPTFYGGRAWSREDAADLIVQATGMRLGHRDGSAFLFKNDRVAA